MYKLKFTDEALRIMKELDERLSKNKAWIASKRNEKKKKNRRKMKKNTHD